ncbi:MAG: ABC transporter ATP-binding protein [Burkholderiaceae bacterium]
MAEPLLRIEALVKRFGGLTATDQVSLDVHAGEVHALIGPNGAGKSTLAAQIAGSLRPDAGRIVFDGDDVTQRAQHLRVAAGLARSHQITSIFGAFTVRRNLALAVQAVHASPWSFWRPAAAEREIDRGAEDIAAQVGLAARLDAVAATLAHGEQRALEIGLALATRPRLLLLDEPLAGTGPEESARMVALIERLSRSVSVLLIEHDMPAVFKLAQRISVLVGGRIIASGAPEVIRNDVAVRAAYLGDEVDA